MTPRPKQYWPPLDGVRAAAIVVVVAYHLGYLGGGWIGVDVFFILSGYLITTLLLQEHQARGRIELRHFWARRARRLLPAVLLLLLVLGIYAWAGGPGVVPAQLRSPALATLFYFANWQQIAFSHNYFAAFAAPTALVHTWSLAIEEQYYIAWPLLVVAVTRGARRRAAKRHRDPHPVPAAGAPRTLLAVTAVLVLSSAVGMGFTAHFASVNRAYLGTDTRAWELLLGGIAAMVVRPVPSSDRHRRGWAAASVMAAAGLAVVIAFASGTGATDIPPMWIWDGGLAGAAMCAAVMITGSVRAPAGPIARLLSVSPVRWLGRVSYSLYLWHWPVIDLVTPSTTGFTGADLLAIRVVLMLGATCVSYYLVERPLRRADWGSWWRRALVPIGVGATAAVLVAATVTPPAATTSQFSANANRSTGVSSAPGPMKPQVIGWTGIAPTRADPLRVWILGDSVMDDSEPGIAAALQATGRAKVVINSAFPTWGLTTTTTWVQTSRQIIEASHPQMIIGTWSWDDTAAEEHPTAYAALLHQALATWLAPGNGVRLVVLLQFPQTGPVAATNRNPTVEMQDWRAQTIYQEAWDSVVQKVVLGFPGRAVYLLTNQLFAPGGRFYTWFKTAKGTWIRTRKLDNTHMCPNGSAELGQLIVNDLAPQLGLGRPSPEWQFGAWTKDANFNDPPGACPDDQPPPGYRGLIVPTARDRQ